MKTKTGRLRLVQVCGAHDFNGDIWLPYGSFYKWEMQEALRGIKNRFLGQIVKYRWRLAGCDKWHIDYV